MNKMRFFTSVIVIALLVAVYWAYTEFLAPQRPAEVDRVGVGEPAAVTARNNNAGSVSAEGQVVPLAQALLSFQIGGEVTEILVEAGQLVARGDPLLRLDGQELDIGLRLAATAVLQAQADVAVAQAELTASEVEAGLADVAIAAAEAELALLTADPTPEQIALQNALIGAASAGVQQAAGNQAVVLEAATDAEIRAAEAELAAAQAQLFSVRLAAEAVTHDPDADPMEQEVAQRQLDAAVANVAAAQAGLDELSAGTTAAEQLAASGALGAAGEQRDAAQAQLDLLLVGSRPEAIVIAEANIELARRAAAEMAVATQQAAAAVIQAEARLVVAETSVRQAQSAFDETILLAPFAGTVAAIPVKVGEVVKPEDPVLTLADFSQWLIETIDLVELDVVNVNVNDPANVVIDAFPGQALAGRVVDIATTSEAVRGTSYTVTIELDNVELPLRWGMTALIVIPQSDSETSSVEP